MVRLAKFTCCWCVLATAGLWQGELVRAADNGLGDRPFMGWSSWSGFRKGFNEDAIAAQADVMAERLKPFGYTYINVDAGWNNENDFDANGRRLPDVKKFPKGIKWLADHIHAKGLKFGVYIEPGLPINAYKENGTVLGTEYRIASIAPTTQPANTLGRSFVRIDFTRAGAAEYVQSSADLLASWNVDFIKFDFVGPNTRRPKIDNRPDMEQWASALRKTGRPVWIALSNNLRIEDADEWRRVGNSWRIDNDIEGRGGKTLTDWPHIAGRFRDVPKWSKFAGPGGWNDLDSLEVGSGDQTGLTLEERRTAMTLWCISCAPLYLGADLTKLEDEDFTIVTNAEAIAVDQAGSVATPVSQKTPQQVWRCKNADGSWTVALFNLGDHRASVTARWSEAGVSPDGAVVAVRDLWSHTDVGESTDSFNADLEPHACRLLKVTPRSSAAK
jgi:hypothetical protein